MRGEVLGVAQAPLWRGEIHCREDGSGTLLFNVHHAIFDGWSFNLLIEELGERYAAAQAGAAYQRPPPPAGSTTAEWARELAQTPAFRASVDYWKNSSAASARVELPADYRQRQGSTPTPRCRCASKRIPWRRSRRWPTRKERHAVAAHVLAVARPGCGVSAARRRSATRTPAATCRAASLRHVREHGRALPDGRTGQPLVDLVRAVHRQSSRTRTIWWRRLSTATSARRAAITSSSACRAASASKASSAARATRPTSCLR